MYEDRVHKFKHVVFFFRKMKMSQFLYAHLHVEYVYFLYDYIPFVFNFDAVKKNVLGIKSTLGSFIMLKTFTVIPQYICISNYRYNHVFLDTLNHYICI